MREAEEAHVVELIEHPTEHRVLLERYGRVGPHEARRVREACRAVASTRAPHFPGAARRDQARRQAHRAQGHRFGRDRRRNDSCARRQATRPGGVRQGTKHHSQC